MSLEKLTQDMQEVTMKLNELHALIAPEAPVTLKRTERRKVQRKIDALNERLMDIHQSANSIISGYYH